MDLESYFEFLGPDSIRLKGHRIDIEHVIAYYQDGYSPEGIIQELPTLSFEQIHATITYYLHNRAVLEQYMARRRVEAERLIAEEQANPPPEVVQRLQRLRLSPRISP